MHMNALCGFVKHEDSGEEYFVHKSGLIDFIHEDDKVEFNIKEGLKGMNAVDVRVV